MDCKYNNNYCFYSQDYESSTTWSVEYEADVDEKLTHMRPVVELETLNMAQYVTLGEIYGIILCG